MKKGQIIWRNTSPYPELQRFFIDEAENNTEKYLEKYKSLIESNNGHYINADLMKETFSVFSVSPINRKKYNLTIHNSAAVLSNELFKQMLESKMFKHCIFLTGAPGAGKTFFIQSLFLTKSISEDTLVYEVNITSPSIFSKIESAQMNSVECSIIVINSPLELSVQNAIERENKIGRSVTPYTMAKIYSEIPDYLLQIHQKYPFINLGIFDKINNYEAKYKLGFENINKLNHGNFETLYKRLTKLMQYYKSKLSNRDNLEEER